MYSKGEGEAGQQSGEEVSWQAERAERCDQEGPSAQQSWRGLLHVHREAPADQLCEHSSDASPGTLAPPGASEMAACYGMWRGERREGVASLSPLLRMHWESQREWSTARGGTGPLGDAPHMCGALLVVGQEPAGAGRYRGHRCSEGTPSRVRKKWGGRLEENSYTGPVFFEVLFPILRTPGCCRSSKITLKFCPFSF